MPYYGRVIVHVLVIALALFGVWQFAGSARNVYADWRFVRSLRVAAIQRQVQQQQQQQLPRPPGLSPALPVMPIAPPSK